MGCSTIPHLVDLKRMDILAGLTFAQHEPRVGGVTARSRARQRRRSTNLFKTLRRKWATGCKRAHSNSVGRAGPCQGKWAHGENVHNGHNPRCPAFGAMNKAPLTTMPGQCLLAKEHGEAFCFLEGGRRPYHEADAPLRQVKVATIVNGIASNGPKPQPSKARPTTSL